MSEHDVETATRLTLWGLLPFVITAGACWFVPAQWYDAVATALVGYGALILTFVGAVHWGVALGARRPAGDSVRLWLSIGPALVAWVSLMLPTTAALLVVASALATMLFIDLALARQAVLPVWYARLRTPVTALAATSLLAGAAATLRL